MPHKNETMKQLTMKQLTVDENGQIQIVGKWKAGELLAIAEEVRRVALEVEIDFKPQQVAKEM